MQIPDIIIAIDGYSSTGKSSFAKLIAGELRYTYLDSGALYRGVTLAAMEGRCISEDRAIDETALKALLDAGLDLRFVGSGKEGALYIGERNVEKDIRSMEVASLVSLVAALPFVRAFVDMKLHEFGSGRRVVMDGRDIGTTVFPDAELKIFMVADADVRARRRAAEMAAKGEEVDLEEVKRNLLERDYMDSHRETSPLSRAEDAIVLDNSYMSFEDQMDWVKGILSSRFGASESE
ncbi:MAG: (d)CMP kinase [Bacteroidales bacterium]|nr:(d)CMP kinase [Bacteroidales bacterium]